MMILKTILLSSARYRINPAIYGGVISGNGPEITIGTEKIGQSLQCAANNGLSGDDMPQSQAVSIDPHTAARLIQDNFQQVQNSAPFQSGNRVEMGQRVQMNCVVKGNPRPVVFWKLRRGNGQVVDALFPQGLNGQYREVPVASQQSTFSLVNFSRLQSIHVSNYSFSGQYWCSACSYVSQGLPECSPGQDAPSDRLLISIDGNDLQMGQQWENFHFEQHVHEDDHRQIVLKLQNQYTQKRSFSSGPLIHPRGGGGVILVIVVAGAAATYGITQLMEARHERDLANQVAEMKEEQLRNIRVILDGADEEQNDGADEEQNDAEPEEESDEEEEGQNGEEEGQNGEESDEDGGANEQKNDGIRGKEEKADN